MEPDSSVEQGTGSSKDEEPSLPKKRFIIPVTLGLDKRHEMLPVLDKLLVHVSYLVDFSSRVQNVSYAPVSSLQQKLAVSSKRAKGSGCIGQEVLQLLV